MKSNRNCSTRYRRQARVDVADVLLPSRAACCLLNRPLRISHTCHYGTPTVSKLSVGCKVVISACPRAGSGDITARRPELNGAEGTVCSIPVYPCTWVGIRLHNGGEVIKVRSSNFVLKDLHGEPIIPVQTDRLRKSLFFNGLKAGTAIHILNHNSYRPPGGFPALAVVITVPVFPR